MTLPTTPELLVLGPDRVWWTHRRRRRLGWLMIVAAVLLTLVAGAGWWRQVSDPNLTRDEIVKAYRQQVTATRGAGWDPASVSTRSDGTELFFPETQPAECAVLMAPDRAPASLDNVQVGLQAPISGSAVTYRYDDPADAELKFDQLREALGRCGTFTFTDTRFRVERLSVGAVSRTRADLTFHVSSGDMSGFTRFDLLRFQNTVTWFSTADQSEQHDIDHARVIEALAAGFRTVH